MSPRGAPDWANRTAPETLLSIFDLAEHAARLGSLLAYDRGGNFVFADAFLAGLNGYTRITSGTGAGVAISPVCPLVGPYSAALTTGDAIGNVAQIERSFSYPASGKAGVECSWSMDGSDGKVHLKLRFYSGDHLWRFGIRYDFDTFLLEYLEPDDTWSELATEVELYNAQGTYHTMKLCVNLDTKSYHRLTINGVTYTITQTQTSVAWTIGPAILSAEIQAQAISAANLTVYVDRLVITQNEP